MKQGTKEWNAIWAMASPELKARMTRDAQAEGGGQPSQEQMNAFANMFGGAGGKPDDKYADFANMFGDIFGKNRKAY